MIIDKAYIEELRQPGKCINEELEQILLITLGTEPHVNEYSEQDIFEQSRKIIYRYKESSCKERAEMLVSSQTEAEIERNMTREEACFYELQLEYDITKVQIKELEDYIEILKKLLAENSIEIPYIYGPVPF
ncbi:MAG TPA: hypothetical protein VIK78_09100 [Ruminiclostridium sp.]